MTIKFTDPMEAIDFTDDQYPDEFSGSIRQNTDNKTVLDIVINGKHCRHEWKLLNETNLIEILNKLDNRISIEDFKKTLIKSNFTINE